MNDLIKIKCPICGSILHIKNQPDLDKKSITCPTCKQKSQIADCKQVAEKNDDDATQYNSKKESGAENTILGTETVGSLGRLVNNQNGSTYQLKLGKNTIGRKVANPLPTVTIPIEEVQTHNTMSREHAIIEVTQLSNGSHRHFLYNWKNKNGTYVNGTQISTGDRYILNDGQTIRLGQVLLRFELNKK